MVCIYTCGMWYFDTPKRHTCAPVFIYRTYTLMCRLCLGIYTWCILVYMYIVACVYILFVLCGAKEPDIRKIFNRYWAYYDAISGHPPLTTYACMIISWTNLRKSLKLLKSWTSQNSMCSGESWKSWKSKKIWKNHEHHENHENHENRMLMANKIKKIEIWVGRPNDTNSDTYQHYNKKTICFYGF